MLFFFALLFSIPDRYSAGEISFGQAGSCKASGRPSFGMHACVAASSFSLFLLFCFRVRVKVMACQGNRSLWTFGSGTNSIISSKTGCRESKGLGFVWNNQESGMDGYVIVVNLTAFYIFPLWGLWD